MENSIDYKMEQKNRAYYHFLAREEEKRSRLSDKIPVSNQAHKSDLFLLKSYRKVKRYLFK